MPDDQNKYSESLIDQKTIDSLLAEAENLGDDLFEDVTGEGSEENSDEHIIDQDEINRLLNNNSNIISEEEEEEETDQVIDQDEIDRLLNSNVESSSDDDDLDDLDFISEDDIAQLMNSREIADDLNSVSEEDINILSNTESLDVNVSGNNSINGEADSLISQEDIDALLNQPEESEKNPIAEDEEKGNSGEDTTIQAEEEEESLISQDDIDALLNQAVTDDIEETEEEESLISQDDIDALLNHAVTDDIEETEEEESLISQDDIDNLLSTASDIDTEAEAAPEVDQETEEKITPEIDETIEEEESIISQDDIDNLLKEKTNDEPEELKGDAAEDATPAETDPEAIVSQDDIDNLLQTADKNDEDEESETLKLVSQKDIDNLLNDEEAEEEAGLDKKNDDKVILEENNDPGDKKEKKKAWFKSKVFIACAGVLFITIISGSLFIFLKKPSKEPAPEIVQTEAIPISNKKNDASQPDVKTVEKEVVKNITTSVLNNFIVPAPAKVKKITYIAVDLTIDFIDVSSDPVKDYEPFFRNIIYEVLKKALVLESELQVNEADLKKMIIEALNDALAEGAVDNVNFTSFKLS